MTPTYYLHNGQLFEIDRMPPELEYKGHPEACHCALCLAHNEKVRGFNIYLSTLQPITHTFSGESRVIPTNQIEWRYEVWDGNFWKEVSSYEYSFAQVVNKRRVATPKITEGYIHSKDCTCALCLAKLEQAITGTPLNESYGYTSTSGISPEPYKPVDKCVTLGCQRASLNDEYCEGPEDCMYKPLTAQPDKEGEDERPKEIDTPQNLAPHIVLKPALCLDFDGTIRQSKSGKQFIENENDIELMPGIEKIITRYRNMGWLIIGISNQGSVAFGYKRPSHIEREMHATFALFKYNPFHIVKYCYHMEGGSIEPFNHRSLLRKPHTGMLAIAEVEAWNAGFMIDWDKSLFVGDRLEDQHCAQLAGITFHYIDEFLNMAHSFNI